MPPEGHQDRIIAGRYRLVDALGAGAQGSVHLAEDLGRGGVPVAVKLVQDVVGGAREEPADAILRHFRHPHWAAILDAGPHHPDGWFQVVELVRGKSLDRIEGAQAVDLVWRLLEDGARVLGAMHRQGLLHYDITPGNVMLDDTGTSPRFVLTDGGLAHVGPIDGVARGTPRFMAPEVTEVGEHDHRADLYSLGLVAFRLATGQDPHDGQGSEILGRRRREDAPRASTIRPEIPPALDDLLAALLSRNPRERPHDAFELLDKLAEARGQPIARFTHAEGVAAAEGGALVGGTDAMARLRTAVDVLAVRRRRGAGRLAAAQAPRIEAPVLVVRGRTGSGASRLAAEAMDLARKEDVPALLMAGRDGPGDRRGPLRRLLEGMAALERDPDEPIEPIHLELGRHRELDREERSHAITRAVEQFVRGVEQTARRTPFLLVVQDFDELAERAQEAVRVLSRHLLAMADQGGSAAAPPVILVVDAGDAETESLLLPDAEHIVDPLLDAAPLTRDEALTFLSARFPGIAPDATDLDRIQGVSEGLPGAMAALLAEGSRRGDLAYESGRWSWNVDALDAYEIQTGLSPTLAEALANADDNLLQLLGYLSLVDAPLDATLVDALWSELTDAPIPSTPLLQRGGTPSRATFSVSGRTAAASAVVQVAGRGSTRKRLQVHLASLGSQLFALDQAALEVELGRGADAVATLSTHWNDLSTAQRLRAQATVNQAVCGDPTLVATEHARSAVATLLEFGEHAAATAEIAVSRLTTSPLDAQSGLVFARVLAAGRRETTALEALFACRAGASGDALLSAEIDTLTAHLHLNLHQVSLARLALQSARSRTRLIADESRRALLNSAMLQMASAQVQFLRGRGRWARVHLTAAENFARRAKSRDLLARTYSNAGIVEQQLGDTRAASHKLRRALAIRRSIGDIGGMLSTLTNLGRVHQQDGALVKSASLFQDAASRAQRHRQAAVQGRALLFLGRVFDQQMNTRLALSTLRRAAVVARAARSYTTLTLVSWDLAPIAASLGETEVVAEMLRISSRAARQRSSTYSRATHHYIAGITALHMGDDSRARVAFARAFRNADGLYDWRRLSLLSLAPVLRLIGVNTPDAQALRPSPADEGRLAYRTGLWARRALRSPQSQIRAPLHRYAPRANSRVSASGEDRRLLAEAAMRLATNGAAQAGGAALQAVEQHLALAGERLMHARALAIRSQLAAATAPADAARNFSRAMALVDSSRHEAGPTVRSQPLPQEHLAAYSAHGGAYAMFDVVDTPSAIEAHALAHRLLLQHGFSATPDDRISNALRRVLAATGRMNAGAGLDDLLQGMTEDTIEITGAERACVVLLDPNSELHMRVEKGVSSVNLGVEVEDLSQTVIQRVIDSQEPLLLHDVFDDYELMGRQSITNLSLRSILCVPMLRGDSLFGVLYADSASAAGSFDSVDQEVLSLFAEQAAAALETHRLVADVQNSMVELKAMQERLVRGERLRTMGELSSGVAHEFNNLLTSILARVQLISLEPVSPELKHDLDLIEKACLDAAEVVRRLQSFTRRERESDFTRLDMHDICKDAVEFLRPLWSTRRRHGRAPVTVKLRARHGLPVMGNPTELREVVTNLLKNSLDALADGGEIVIEAKPMAGGVMLRVEDDGPGIPEDVRARVFDPFFTTKGERGTGLGLCLSQQIVERHGGSVELWSELGQGTRFTIELPLASSQRLSATTDAAAPTNAPTTNVLVIDDDENVRVPLCRFLERSGYGVHSAGDAEEGLRIARDHVLDVVISDVAMPGMDGVALCERMCQDMPGLPVILMSGWAQEKDPARARRAGAARLLKKPFALQEVEAAVRAALGGSEGTPSTSKAGTSSSPTRDR